MRIFILFLLTFSFLNANEVKKVSLQLLWKNQFQFAGFIMAKEKGFYKEKNLDVKIKEWQNGIDMVDEVLNGHSEFAIARPTSMIDIAKGKKIIYLASIYQSSPLIFLTDKSLGITNIKQFQNKRIMSTGSMNSDASLISMMFSQGINYNTLNIQKPSFSPKDLLDGKTDLIAAYISNEPYTLKELGGDPIIFNPEDYGFSFYNDIIITSEKFLKSNPKDVENFRKQSLKGWEYAFFNIEETINIIYKKYNSLNKSKNALRYEAKKLKELAYFKTKKIGIIKEDKLEKIYNIYKLLGLVKNNIDFNKIIYDNSLSRKNELTLEEKEFIKNKKTIKFLTRTNRPPFEFEEDDQAKGIAVDYLKKVCNNVGLKAQFILKNMSFDEILTKIKNGTNEFDTLTLLTKTTPRSKVFSFGKAYLSSPLMIITHKNYPYVDKLSNFLGKRIALEKDFLTNTWIKRDYPKIKIIEAKDTLDALSMANEKKVDAYVGNMSVASYMLGHGKLNNIKIAAPSEYKNIDYSFVAPKNLSILTSILNKGYAKITPKEHNLIQQKWFSVQTIEKINYALIWKILIVVSLVIVLFTWWNRKLTIAKNKLEKAQKLLEEKNKELEVISKTDRLTGICNRMSIDTTIEKEFSRTKRSGETFGVAIIDIDHFKKVNDTYGHLEGDKVLIQIAKILKSNIRLIDSVGRWGGEEFLIICPNTKEKGMLQLAKNLKEKLENHNFKNINQITGSFGVTTFKDSDTIETIIKRADDALYEAKNSGRNKIVIM